MWVSEGGITLSLTSTKPNRKITDDGVKYIIASELICVWSKVVRLSSVGIYPACVPCNYSKIR